MSVSPNFSFKDKYLRCMKVDIKEFQRKIKIAKTQVDVDDLKELIITMKGAMRKIRQCKDDNDCFLIIISLPDGCLLNIK